MIFICSLYRFFFFTWISKFSKQKKWMKRISKHDSRWLSCKSK